MAKQTEEKTRYLRGGLELVNGNALITLFSIHGRHIGKLTALHFPFEKQKGRGTPTHVNQSAQTPFKPVSLHTHTHTHTHTQKKKKKKTHTHTRVLLPGNPEALKFLLCKVSIWGQLSISGLLSALLGLLVP